MLLFCERRLPAPPGSLGSAVSAPEDSGLASFVYPRILAAQNRHGGGTQATFSERRGEAREEVVAKLCFFQIEDREMHLEVHSEHGGKGEPEGPRQEGRPLPRTAEREAFLRDL